jgi:plasmid stability protein
VPDKIVRRLRARAKANHRSLQGELLSILETETATLTLEEALGPVDRMGFRTPDEATDIIRRDRDRDARSRG